MRQVYSVIRQFTGNPFYFTTEWKDLWILFWQGALALPTANG